MLRKKLDFDDQRADEARALLEELAADRPAAPGSVESASGDPPTTRSWRAPSRPRVDILATGDRRHLLPLAEYRGVRILTPQATLAVLRNDE